MVMSVERDVKRKKKDESRKDDYVKQDIKRYKKGELHVGSKKGPLAKSKKQAEAIGYAQARKKDSKDEREGMRRAERKRK